MENESQRFKITSRLTYTSIFIFWIPLGATWLMMSVEGPLLSALIARLAEPKFNLAAYGVAYALALIVEAPVIMIMTASTALVKGKYSFKKLKQFTYLLNASITLIMLIIVIPDIFYFLTEVLIGLPGKISSLTHTAMIILIPWPAAIGYRRFYQGILIRNNMTRRVAYGTVVRLSTMAIVAFILFVYNILPGAIVGASALSLAVIAEALASKLMAIKTIKELNEDEFTGSEKLTGKDIFKFYYPLALMSLLSLGVHPFVTFFVGQSRMAIESLAVLPVVTSFIFIFRAFGLSYQEVIIAKIGDDKSEYKPLRNFAVLLASFLSVTIMIIAFTPLAKIWFREVSGLSKSLTDFSILPLQIMSVIPALTVLISFQRSLLVSYNHTKPISWGTAIEFAGIVLVMLVATKIFTIVGAVAATIAFVLGRLAANMYLAKSIRIVKQNIE